MTAGIFLAILASATFAFNTASMRRGMFKAAASQGLYVTIYLGCVLFIIASAVSGQLFDAGEMSLRDYQLLVAGGFLHIMAGRYCNYRAMDALGANRAAPIVGLSTIGSIVIAVIFLEESVDAIQGAGIALVLAGPVLVKPRNKRVDTPSGGSGSGPDAVVVSQSGAFTPKIAEGYLFGSLAAGLWGVGPVLMRAGIDSTGLGVWGGTIAYATAAVVLLVPLAIPGQAKGALRLDKDVRWWFILGAVGSFLANVFRFSALALAPVSVVIPLMRTSFVFQIGFNYLINRSIESFEPRVIAGIVISLAGAILIAT